MGKDAGWLRAALAAAGGYDTALMGRYTAGGGRPGATRRGDLEVLADALTRTEDEVELQTDRGAPARRVALRAVRHRLECVLWP